MLIKAIGELSQIDVFVLSRGIQLMGWLRLSSIDHI